MSRRLLIWAARGRRIKEWTDCVAEDRRLHGLHGITRDWSTTGLDPGVWYSTVREGGCRFIMAAWVKEEEKASEHRQRKREAEEADKVEVAPPAV